MLTKQDILINVTGGSMYYEKMQDETVAGHHFSEIIGYAEVLVDGEFKRLAVDKDMKVTGINLDRCYMEVSDTMKYS